MGDEYVSTEHLLAGLAAEGGPVADLLRRNGATEEALREAFIKVRGSARVTTPDPESDSIRSNQKQELERLMASLPEEHRTVLMLREIEEMDYAQIAAVTEVPIGTVMSRLARSRAALKTKWMQEVEGVPRAVR